MLLAKAKKLNINNNIAKKFFINDNRLPKVNKLFGFKGKATSKVEKVRFKNETKKFSPIEEKFRYKQIRHFYDLNVKRKKGYSNEYFQSLSNLLHENGKNYQEERLKLLDSVTPKKKEKKYINLNLRNNNKFRLNNTFITLSGGRHNIKSRNYIKLSNSMIKSHKILNQKNFNSYKKINYTDSNERNNKYYKTDQAFYLYKNKGQNINDLKKRQINISNSFDSFENENENIIEQYLSERNDYKYKKNLKEIYHFYESPSIKMLKDNYEKDLRNKMFKCNNDMQYTNLKMKEPYKEEFFHKFQRLGGNYFSPVNLYDNKLTFIDDSRLNKIKNQLKNEEYMKIYKRIRKGLENFKK